MALPLKPTAIILCGPPGSGKSTYVNKSLPDHFVSVSRDAIRLAMFGKHYKQDNKLEQNVTKAFDHLLREAVASKQNVVIDNTNCRESYLDEFIGYFTWKGYNTRVKFFNTPLWLCRIREIKRRLKRDGRKVPHFIIKGMKSNFDNIDQTKYPTLDKLT